MKPHSAKYEDEKGNSNVLVKLVECGYLVSVSSQSHAITPFLLNRVLATHHFELSRVVLGTASKHQIYRLALAASPIWENQLVSDPKIFL